MLCSCKLCHWFILPADYTHLLRKITFYWVDRLWWLFCQPKGRFSKLDLQLARKCLEEGRAVVIAANKSDLVALRGITNLQYEQGVRAHCEVRKEGRKYNSLPLLSIIIIVDRQILLYVNEFYFWLFSIIRYFYCLTPFKWNIVLK